MTKDEAEKMARDFERETIAYHGSFNSSDAALHKLRAALIAALTAPPVDDAMVAELESLRGELAAAHHVGWLYHNPSTGIEWSQNHPIKSGECDDAENVRPARAGALKDLLIEAWQAQDAALAQANSAALPAPAVSVAEAVAAEREACAKIADDADKYRAGSTEYLAMNIAAAIRARAQGGAT